MRPPPSLRIVLQTGASAGVARLFAVAFAYAALFGAALIGAQYWAGEMPAPHKYVMWLAPLMFAGGAVFSHVWLWQARATDLLLGPDGLHVLGGENAGRTFRWDAIDPGATGIETDGNITVSANGTTTPQRRLVLGLRDGSRATLATSTNPDEQLSFAALLTTLREAALPDAAPVDHGPAEVIRCEGCAAPVMPADARAVACWRCDRVVALPDALRDRVRAQAVRDDARAAVDRGLAVALRQPRAEVANTWLAAALVAPYLLPGVLCFASVPFAPFFVLAVFALPAAAKLQFARRAAFHRLAVVFAARPAEAPGAPLRCRSCAGPLPAGDTVTIRCPWCEADNLRALQLDRPAALWQSAAADLSTFLAERSAAVLWPKLVAGFWVVVAVGVGFV